MNKEKIVFAITYFSPIHPEMEICRRIEVAAKNIGVTCYFVGPDGIVLQTGKHISGYKIDFVLVFDPAQLTLFDNFVYHLMWFVPGLVSELHAITYDIFSENCDDHLCFPSKKSLDYYTNYYTTVNNEYLYPSVPYNFICEPLVFEGKGNSRYKAFYAGINVDSKNVRHEYLFRHLESKGIVDLYGPKIINGKRNWIGFKSYRGEINFDGHSMIETANRSGVTLALHHKAHKLFSMPTNRLFEGLAAGTLVITERMSFIEKIFGDTIFYLDPKLTEQEKAFEIEKIISWANNNPLEARNKIIEAQKIFRDKFELTKILSQICKQHHTRKQQLFNLSIDRANNIAVTVVCDVFKESDLSNCLLNLKNQDYDNIHVLVVLRIHDLSEEFRRVIDEIKSKFLTEIISVHDEIKYEDDNITSLAIILKDNLKTDAFCLFNPKQYWHHNHIRTLAQALVENGSLGAYSGCYFIGTDFKQTPILFNTIECLDEKIYNCFYPTNLALKDLFQRELPESSLLFRSSVFNLLSQEELENAVSYLHLILVVMIRLSHQQLSFSRKITTVYSNNPSTIIPELNDGVYHYITRINDKMSSGSLSFVFRKVFKKNKSYEDFLTDFSYRKQVPVNRTYQILEPLNIFKTKVKKCLLILGVGIILIFLFVIVILFCLV